MRLRSWPGVHVLLLLAIVALGVWFVIGPLRDARMLPVYVGFSGDVDRLSRLLAGATAAQVRGMLWREAAAVGAVFVTIVAVNRGADHFHVRRFRNARAAALTLAVIGLAATIVADLLAIVSVHTGSGGAVSLDGNAVAVAVMTASALAACAVVAAIVATLLRLVSALLPTTRLTTVTTP